MGVKAVAMSSIELDDGEFPLREDLFWRNVGLPDPASGLSRGGEAELTRMQKAQGELREAVIPFHPPLDLSFHHYLPNYPN